MNSIYKNIIQLSVLIVCFVIIGSLGFYYIEDLSWIDSVWYTIMTLTTVGYGMPENISFEGKLLTIFLMLFGIGIVFYGLTNLALEIINGNVLRKYKQNKMNKEMQHLDHHFILCGFGRNGVQVAKRLESYHKKYIVIDLEDWTSESANYGHAIFLKGNGTEDKVLEKAGIRSAEALITTLPSDADNLFIVLSARQLNPQLKIISRASDVNSCEKLKIAGADNVIMPHKIGGEHMASLLLAPDLMEFVDNINISVGNQNNLLEISTNRFNKKCIGLALSGLEIRKKTGCSVIGYKTKDNQYIVNPDDEQIVEENSYIIVLGKPEQIQFLKENMLV